MNGYFMKKINILLLSLTSVSAFAGTTDIKPTKEATVVTGVTTGGGAIEYKVRVFEDEQRNVTCYVAYGEIAQRITRDNLGGAGMIALGNPNISCIKH